MVSKKKSDIKSISDIPKSDLEKFPTMLIADEKEIALDFATKVYHEFQQIAKAIVYFGSSARQESLPESDIDLIIIIDDVTVKWDEEMISTYREELGKIIQSNPYIKPLHVNTVKLSTWWQDLMKGDPVLINVLRYGEALIDHGGFFNPQKALLLDGKIRSTPEAIYSLLQRTPAHMARSRASIFNAIDGYYWACVDSAHAALIAAGVLPPSPEHIAENMEEKFVKTKIMNSKFVEYYTDVHSLMKEITHGKIADVSGKKLDQIRENTDIFIGEMARIVNQTISKQ
jgi:predicted nucleotidyltransferase